MTFKIGSHMIGEHLKLKTNIDEWAAKSPTMSKSSLNYLEKRAKAHLKILSS